MIDLALRYVSESKFGNEKDGDESFVGNNVCWVLKDFIALVLFLILKMSRNCNKCHFKL